jgi:hypothetical protein
MHNMHKRKEILKNSCEKKNGKQLNINVKDILETYQLGIQNN